MTFWRTWSGMRFQTRSGLGLAILECIQAAGGIAIEPGVEGRLWECRSVRACVAPAEAMSRRCG